MPKLYLVRHAEPVLRGVLLGSCDPSLSEAGRRHAESLSLPTGRVYTSALKRARETAEAFGADTYVQMKDLNEISYGDWDGWSWSKIATIDPQLAARKLADWFGVPAPGGEDWQAFQSRVDGALQIILSEELPAVVVAHLAVNSVIAQRLTGIDPAQFTQDYCEVLEYDV